MAPQAVPSSGEVVAVMSKGTKLVPAAGCCPKAQIAHILDQSVCHWMELVRISTPSGPMAARAKAASLIDECQRLWEKSCLSSGKAGLASGPNAAKPWAARQRLRSSSVISRNQSWELKARARCEFDHR